MKRRTQWGLLVLVVLVIAVAAQRMLGARKAQQQALAPVAQAVVELGPGDVVPLTERELSTGLPIAGTLRALNSAVVKARVAGELQGLTLREGDPVQAGQVIARIEATEYQARLRQAQEQAESARAQIEIAQRQFDNNRALVNQGFISKTALDTSASSLQAARASHLAALAAADVARKALDDAVLRAPISGFIAQRLAQPGERLGVDARVVEIVDPARLEVEVPLSAADSLAVRVGQRAELQIEGAPRRIAARVARIGPSVQAGSRSVLAYLLVEQAEGLRQGLFVQGRLDTGRSSGPALPLTALRTDRPAPYVQVVDNGQVAHHDVTPGERGEIDGQAWVRVEGLAPQTQVIAGSVGLLRAGTAVRLTATGQGR